MKSFFSALLLALPILTQGQINRNEVPSQNNTECHWYLGMYFSPEWMDLELIDKVYTASSIRILNRRNQDETFKIGYSTGLTIGYQLNSNWAIESGLAYYNKGNSYRKTKLSYGSQIDPRHGFHYESYDVNPPSHLKILYNYHYIGIPVSIQYSLGKNKWRFTSKIGCSVEYLVRASSTAVFYYQDDKKNRNHQKSNSDYEKHNFSPHAGIGVQYNLNSKMRLTMTPTVHYGVLNIIDANITGKLFGGGVQFGCFLKL